MNILKYVLFSMFLSLTAQAMVERYLVEKWDEFFDLDNETIIRLVKNDTTKTTVEYLSLICDAENKIELLKSQLKHYELDPYMIFAMSTPYYSTPSTVSPALLSYYNYNEFETGPVCDFSTNEKGILQSKDVACEKEKLSTTYLLEMCCRKEYCPEQLNASFEQVETIEI